MGKSENTDFSAIFNLHTHNYTMTLIFNTNRQHASEIFRDFR